MSTDLRTAAQALVDALEGMRHGQQIDEAEDALRAALASPPDVQAVERDAARFRWTCNHPNRSLNWVADLYRTAGTVPMLCKAIDAEIAADAFLAQQPSGAKDNQSTERETE